LAATQKSYGFSYLGGTPFCHVVLVPNNAALKNIEVTEQNRDALSMVLRSHFIGGTKLEDADFSQSGTIVRSSSGAILKLARTGNGAMTVNGSTVTSGTLRSPGHTILVVSDVLPELSETITSAVESLRSKSNYGPGYYPDVLKNITGKPAITFAEIAGLCGFEERLNAGNVTVLLPRRIKQINTPILRDLFASDKEFVCHSFKSNIIEGRYTSNDLLKLAKSGTNTIASIDGRAFALSYGNFVREWAAVGDDKTQVFGPNESGGTGYLIGERHGPNYTIIEAEDLISLD
jgi:hypothetical protein